MRKKLSSFAKFRRKYHLSVTEAATTFEVTIRTIQYWQYREPPRWAKRIIERQERWLSGIDGRWAGWRIGWDGRLYGPHGFSTTAEHLRHEALSAWMEREQKRRKG